MIKIRMKWIVLFRLGSSNTYSIYVVCVHTCAHNIYVYMFFAVFYSIPPYIVVRCLWNSHHVFCIMYFVLLHLLPLQMYYSLLATCTSSVVWL